MRLIDADALKEAFSELLTDGYVATYGSVESRIDNAPTVDAVPIVRCKDCIYWQDNNGGYPVEKCKWKQDETSDPDDYCSLGEKAGDDE